MLVCILVADVNVDVVGDDFDDVVVFLVLVFVLVCAFVADVHVDVRISSFMLMLLCCLFVLFLFLFCCFALLCFVRLLGCLLGCLVGWLLGRLVGWLVVVCLDLS